MEIELPSEIGFTIYSKSGCPNCLKVKKILHENKLSFNIINSDEYILEDKEYFLNFIKELSGIEVKSFPIIFYEKAFIGGYKEIIEIIDELLLAFDHSF